MVRQKNAKTPSILLLKGFVVPRPVYHQVEPEFPIVIGINFSSGLGHKKSSIWL
jgi:hypothetical protein